MLNLLFISDSPKIDNIKCVLQPELKVIIDVVTDFDHGLKDVFEKRPTTVCIQDQIGGVTGESVARHIQMLLGSGAPTFILLSTAHGKARPIKGLYEHFIDMSQADNSIVDEIKNTLKSLLGTQWEKVYIPPKRSPSSVRSAVAVPEGSREDADKLVDDFLSDLETSNFLIVDDQPSPFTSAPDEVSRVLTVSSQADNQENSLKSLERAKDPTTCDEVVEPQVGDSDKSTQSESINQVTPSIKNSVGAVVTDFTKQEEEVSAQPVAINVQSEFPATNTATKKTATLDALPSVGRERGRVRSVLTSETQAPVSSAAAEFRISHETSNIEEPIPEDLLLAFEKNYRKESFILRRSVIIVLVLLVSAAGVWYLMRQKPQIAHSLKQRFMPFLAGKKVPVSVPVSVSAPVPVQKTLPPSKTQIVVSPVLPSFIPESGHDATYAVKNPGWERYRGKNAEFRVYSASGHIKAVQVLSANNVPISEKFIISTLQEFAGSSQYRIASRKNIAGVTVEYGSIQNKTDIIIYKKNGVIHAFVVSVN